MNEYIYEHVQSGADHMGKQVELPTLVQREEIVRCRDCKFCSFDECTRIDEGFKDYWFAIEPDGFCTWACRKEGDE